MNQREILKEHLLKVARYLWKCPKMNHDNFIGLIAPLHTPEQADEMYEYLQTVDMENTKLTPLITKALEIGEKSLKKEY